MKRKKNPLSLQNNDVLPRLAILKAFMITFNITISAAAQAVGKSPITVARWLQPCIDDCHLSDIQRICQAYGYNFLISFSDIPLEVYQTLYDKAGGRTEILIRNPQSMLTIPLGWKNKKSRQHLVECSFPRLQCIMDAIARANLTRGEFATKMGLSTATIDSMFRRDDTKMSRIIDIAQRLDTKVRFTITPMHNLLQVNNSRCIYEIKLVSG